MNKSAPYSFGRPMHLVVLVVTIAALYLARDLLIPIALSILISFLLYPIVVKLVRLRVPRPLAAGVATGVALILCSGLGYIVTRQALELTTQLPDYTENLKAKIRSLKPSGDGTVARLNDAVEDIKKELTTTAPAVTVEQRQNAVPVQVMQEEPDVLTVAADWSSPVFGPLATAAVVFVLVLFTLIGADELRDRLIWLAGTGQISLTTTVLDDIGTTIGRFLRYQLIVAALHGTMVAVALLLIGLPNALLWGLLSAVLRYIPYVGPWAAAAMPFLLSIATSNGWTQPLIIAVALIAIESFTNGVLEPWLYGSSAGMTSWAIVVTAVFWAWLWGPMGLVLAVPLTTCLVVIGKYVPQFSIFTRILGDGDALPVEGRLYQRLIVWDEHGAEQIVEAAGKDRSSIEICDELLVPVLHTMKQDLLSGAISVEQVLFSMRCVDEIDQFGDDLPDEPVERPALLVIAAQNEVDDIAARTLARIANKKGYPAEAISSRTLASESALRAQEAKPLVIAVVQSEPCSLANATYLIKSLHKRLPETPLLAICFHPDKPSPAAAKRLTNAGARQIVGSFKETIGFLSSHASLKRVVEEEEHLVTAE